jgi:hypothetical protein
MRYVAFLLAAVAALSACASGTGGGTETGGPKPQANLLRAAEIAEARTEHNAYEAIQQLRPQWLTPRPSRSTSDPRPLVPVAFVDTMELGELTTLRTIAVTDVVEIHYYDSREAVARFGTKYNSGIIQVVTR